MQTKNEIERDLERLLEAMTEHQVAELEGLFALRDITWRLANDQSRSAIRRADWKNIAQLYQTAYRIPIACAEEN